MDARFGVIDHTKRHQHVFPHLDVSVGGLYRSWIDVTWVVAICRIGICHTYYLLVIPHRVQDTLVLEHLHEFIHS